MTTDVLKGAETISKFCRLNINKKKDLPLRASQIGFLIYLQNNENSSITPVEAAHFFGVTKAVITKTVAPLIEKGYIIKTPSVTDKRSYILSATESARKLVADANNEYYKIINALLKELGLPKYRTFIGLLDQANSIIEDMQ